MPEFEKARCFGLEIEFIFWVNKSQEALQHLGLEENILSTSQREPMLPKDWCREVAMK